MGTYNVELTLLFFGINYRIYYFKKKNQDLNLEEPNSLGVIKRLIQAK